MRSRGSYCSCECPKKTKPRTVKTKQWSIRSKLIPRVLAYMWIRSSRPLLAHTSLCVCDKIGGEPRKFRRLAPYLGCLEVTSKHSEKVRINTGGWFCRKSQPGLFFTSCLSARYVCIFTTQYLLTRASILHYKQNNWELAAVLPLAARVKLPLTMRRHSDLR